MEERLRAEGVQFVDSDRVELVSCLWDPAEAGSPFSGDL